MDNWLSLVKGLIGKEFGMKGSIMWGGRVTSGGKRDWYTANRSLSSVIYVPFALRLRALKERFWYSGMLAISWHIDRCILEVLLIGIRLADIPFFKRVMVSQRQSWFVLSTSGGGASFQDRKVSRASLLI